MSETTQFDGGVVAELRKEHDLSQEDLIFELRLRGQKISRTTLSGIENGTGQSPRADLVAALADVFECEPDRFFRRVALSA